MDDFKDIDELREEVEFLQRVSRSQKKEIPCVERINLLSFQKKISQSFQK